MKLKKGDILNDLSLPSTDGKIFNINEHKGKKIFLTFYRFAACPFCNLRINKIIKKYDQFGNNFLMVAVFDSSLENLIKHSKKHNAPFPILADDSYKYYKKYGIERSFLKFLRAVIFRLPSFDKELFLLKPLKVIKFKPLLIAYLAAFRILGDSPLLLIRIIVSFF